MAWSEALGPSSFVRGVFQSEQKGSATKGASKHKAPWILQNYRALCCRPHMRNLEVYSDYTRS